MTTIDRLTATAAAVLLCASGCHDEAPSAASGTESGGSGDTDPANPPPADPAAYHVLDGPRRLLRASMALRGTRPSRDEYQRVIDDPAAFPTIVDEYLQSPAFGATVRHHFTEWMELDQSPDIYPAGFPALGALSGLTSQELNGSIIDAPGRLAQFIVEQDRPWSEIVTADYTLADSTVATVWGIPYDHALGGWQVSAYDDGRPLAGVLSDGWVFTRMPSTENNRQRERASLIANSLICHDYPGRPVLLPPDLDLTAPDATANAIENNPVCIGCHHTLDPLSSFFTVHYALRFPEYEVAYPLQQYTPNAGAGYEPPMWYGQPASGLEELGTLIADDPRFGACAVRRFYSELLHVEVEAVPQSRVGRFLPLFLDSDMNVRELVRAIVLSDEFAAVAVADPGGAEPLDVGPRKATPQQLDSMFADLVGYQWRAEVGNALGTGVIGSVPLMRDYVWGFRTLAGGPNNFDTTTHRRTADPTTLLTLRALAERAARRAVADGPAGLVSEPGALAGDVAAVRAQLVDLHLLLYGEVLESDDVQVTDAVGFFEAAQGLADPERGWAVLLAAMFQDPRMLHY